MAASNYIEPVYTNVNDMKYWYDWFVYLYWTKIEQGATPVTAQEQVISWYGSRQLGFGTTLAKQILTQMNAALAAATNGTAKPFTVTQQTTYEAPPVGLNHSNFEKYSVPVDPGTKEVYNYINFAGTRSGQLLEVPTWYPADYPKMQIAANGRLCWWDWKNTKDWCNMDWWQGTIFKNVPLTPPESMRFEAGYNQAKLQGKNEDECLFAGSMATMGGNAARNKFTQIGDIYKYNGAWTWKQRTGGGMLTLLCQWYVDLFIKQPYDVSATMMYDKNYLGQLMQSMKDGQLNIFLSNVNYFIPPKDEPTFWQKLLTQYIPLAIVTVASIVSAGAGTPALAALAIAFVAGKTMDDINNQIKQDAIKAGSYEAAKAQAELDAAAAQKAVADKALQDAGIIPGKTNWLLLGAIALGTYFFINKKRR